MYVLLPNEYSAAGIVAAHVGLMLAANRGIRIFLNGPMADLADRIPRRRIMIPAMTLGGIASLLYVVGGFWPLLLGRLLWGAAWSGIYLGAVSMALDVATLENRGALVGRLQMWFSFGTGISGLLGGVLFDLFGFGQTFLVSAGLIFLMSVAWWRWLPETKSDVATEAKPRRIFYIPSLNHPALRLVMVLHGLNWLLFIGIALSIIPILLKERVGETVTLFGLLSLPLASLTGVIFFFNMMVSVIASPLSGHLTDRRGQRWGVVAGTVALGALLMMMGAVGYGLVAVTVAIFNGAVISTLTTQLTALVGDYAEQERGQILGFMNTVGDFCGSLGPILAFALLPTLGLIGLYGVGAALMLLALFWVVRAGQDGGRQPIVKRG